ncbi:oligosaccharide flippase family protein [Crocinitomicaceae bacterium CZZ-1]|uniref:Oligosaccharide flippase family protein n=1 Tax=Taishania pollutisoli TaxID=2766479 RepID=A0A8J6P3P7_9FLAO|nr:oligosaccharide flippase family protein [Taishania pollutisoli]MBC9810849.1 oligosaccharide flippase family protein [Taishania pollutisoli]MBX2949596.1 oligosaccharide flippase family protein [Crocinitomicaceae bacterium]
MKASQNITRSSLLTLLSQFPAHILGIVAGIFIARILGPEGKGLHSIFYADVTLFYTVFGFSITNSIIFFTANKRISKERIKTIVSMLLVLTMLLSVVALIIWVNSDYVELFLPDYELSVSLLLLFLATIFIAQVNSVFTAYFQGLRHFKIVNKILIINGAYGVFLFTVAYLLHFYGYYTFRLLDVIAVSFLILVLNTVHWCIYYVKNERVRFDYHLKWERDFAPFFRFAGMNHVASILAFFNHRIILWFIAYYLDNWQLGIFSLGISLAQLLNPISLVLESFLSADRSENQLHIFSSFSRIQFTAILLLCIVAAMLSPYLIPWLYGNDFRESVSILYIILVGVLMSCQSTIFSSFFLANDRLKYNVIASLTGVVTTVVSAPILIQKYQIIGAAYSQLLTYSTVFLYQYILVRTRTKVDFNLFILTRSDIQYIKQQLKLVKQSKREDADPN